MELLFVIIIFLNFLSLSASQLDSKRASVILLSTGSFSKGLQQ